ncbi:MAG: hypothetical protein JWO98_4790, partial [Frankiales bacterium]|nr:hypothetical protein [Frankiales bacterium]
PHRSPRRGAQCCRRLGAGCVRGCVCPGPHQRLAYSVDAAAEQLSISQAALEKLISAGRIPVIRYGNGSDQVAITHEALVAFVRGRADVARPSRGETPAAVAESLDAASVAALANAAHIKLAAGAAITSAELAAVLGLDERTVHRQAREGRYPSQQPTGPGGARRFFPEDVAAVRAAIALGASNGRPSQPKRRLR